MKRSEFIKLGSLVCFGFNYFPGQLLKYIIKDKWKLIKFHITINNNLSYFDNLGDYNQKGYTEFNGVFENQDGIKRKINFIMSGNVEIEQNENGSILIIKDKELNFLPDNKYKFEINNRLNNL